MTPSPPSRRPDCSTGRRPGRGRRDRSRPPSAAHPRAHPRPCRRPAQQRGRDSADHRRLHPPPRPVRPPHDRLLRRHRPGTVRGFAPPAARLARRHGHPRAGHPLPPAHGRPGDHRRRRLPAGACPRSLTAGVRAGARTGAASGSSAHLPLPLREMDTPSCAPRPAATSRTECDRPPRPFGDPAGLSRTTAPPHRRKRPFRRPAAARAAGRPPVRAIAGRGSP